MILKALNGNKLSQYGYDDEFVYTDSSFHGHQIGISIGVTDTLTGDIVYNYISSEQGDINNRNKILRSIIDNPSIIKIEKPINQFENGSVVSRTIWMLPYAAIEHSAFQETLNFSNIVYSPTAINHVVLELLFVEDNLNRYMTVSYDTTNVSIIEFVTELFSKGYLTANPNELRDIEFTENEYGETELCLDFYDEAGERIMLCFEDEERLRDALVSVRLLEVDTITDGN